MIVAAFSIVNKVNRVKFFEETFLVANVSPEVVFGITFFTLSNTNIDFSGWELQCRIYTIKQALPTARNIELVGNKEFVAVALDQKHKTYVVYVESISFDALPSSFLFDVHLSRKPQIFGLIAKKAPTKVSIEYSDFTDVFSLDYTSKLPKYTMINDHTIKLVNGCQQPPYKPI